MGLTSKTTKVHRKVLDDGALALVTARLSAGDASEQIFPTIWRVRADQQIEPLQHCLRSDCELGDDFVLKINLYSQMWHPFSSETGLNNFWAYRYSVNMFFGEQSKEYIAIESTETNLNANIVNLRKREQFAGGITILWKFNGVAQQRCMPFQQCVPRSPGHVVILGHEFVEGD